MTPVAPAPATPGRRVLDRLFPAAAFVALGAVLWVTGALSVEALGYPMAGGLWRPFPDRPWFDGWCRFDSGWYHDIAERGYEATGGTGQRPFAFFPGFPLALRALRPLTGDTFLAGILVSVAAGAACTLLLDRWCRLRRLDAGSLRAAVLTLLTHPFGFVLYGAVYSDGLFLALALAAFVCLDEDAPVLAGLLGALATATRPMAPALTLGLALRALERRGVVELTRNPGGRWPRPSFRWARLQARDLAVLLSALGMVAYGVFLWRRFGDPFAFLSAAEDWHGPQGPGRWFKLWALRKLVKPWGWTQACIVLHLTVFAAAAALVPRVLRRFGWAYAAYAALVLAIAFVNNSDVVGGLGRYTLAAFPCFGAAGEWIEEERSRRPLLAPCLVAMVLVFIGFARWRFVT